MTSEPGTAPSESVALQQVREAAQSMLAQGKVDEAFEFLVSALDAVLRKSADLELLLAKLRRERIGKRSERIDPAQLQLLLCRTRQVRVNPGGLSHFAGGVGAVASLDEGGTGAAGWVEGREEVGHL